MLNINIYISSKHIELIFDEKNEYNFESFMSVCGFLRQINVVLSLIPFSHLLIYQCNLIVANYSFVHLFRGIPELSRLKRKKLTLIFM